MRLLITLLFYAHIYMCAKADTNSSIRYPSYKQRNGSSNSAKFLGGFYKSRGILENSIHSILSVANLSANCSRDVNRFAKEILSFLDTPTLPINSDGVGPESWALQMVDAWPKIPDGVLSGHVNALGDYDECVGVRASSPTGESRVDKADNLHFQGKYCLVYVIPNFSQLQYQSESTVRLNLGERSIENLMKILSVTVQGELPAIPSYGSCLPSTCSDGEVLQIVKAILQQLNVTPVAAFCSIAEPLQIDTGALTTLSILGVLALCVLVATIADFYCRRHTDLQQNDFTTTLTPKYFSVLRSFSLRMNLERFLKTETNKNEIGCLHGLRFIGAAWVVLCHTYLCGTQVQPVYNLMHAYSYLTTGPFSAFVVNAAIVVDIFLVIGGFLASLTLLSALEKSKGKLNLAVLYIQRYLRITPLYGIIILMGTFIFPLLGSGPYWHVAKTWAGFCKRNWWKNLLFINNLPIYNTVQDPTDGPCHGLAWYLGVDMQLFLLSPFLLYPIWKWKMYGSAPLIGITVTSAVLPGLITYLQDYLPLQVPFGSAENRFSQLAYTPTYMRATPYLIGMCTGLLFHSTRKTKSIWKDRALNITAAWLMSIATIFAVLISPQKFLDGQYHFKTEESAIYVSGHRTAWALAVSWLIYACGSGYGGWVNQFLSWKPFVPLSRLTFAIYLVSLHIQFLFHLQYRQPIYFSNYLMVNLFFSHLVMSTLVAFLCMMLIEAPAMNLLKIFSPSANTAKAVRSSQTVFIEAECNGTYRTTPEHFDDCEKTIKIRL